MSNISLRMLMSLNILLSLGKPRTVLLFKNQSGLCTPRDMPCRPDNPEICSMRYYKLNSTECENMSFNEGWQSSEDMLGNVELRSYLYDLLSFKTTGLNVTFTNIKWKHLKFRFRQRGYDMKNTCREFKISANAVMNDFFYDCLWSNETYEGKPFFFEYEASDDSVKVYRKFSFIVPFAFNMDEEFTNLKDWECLTYVELVSVLVGLGPSKFLIYWQPLPQVFSVEAYNISVTSKESETEEVIHSEIVKCNNSENCNFVYSKWLGTLRFGVQPVCMNITSCKTSYTIYFQVGGEKTKPLLIGIACTTIALLVLYYLVCALRKYVTGRIRSSIKTPPKVLVIHSSSVTSHANVVLNFVEYLKNYCRVEPLVDELHISLSKSKDPFKWCNEAFRKADLVMVIASPRFGCNKPCNSIYRNTDALLLRMLRENLGMYSSKTKYFVLMMPYTTERDVPKEAENLRKFYFPRDLNKTLRFIHGNRILAALFGCELHGGEKEYRFLGNKLNASIEEAGKYLEKEKKSAIVAEIEDGIDSAHQLLTLRKRDAGLGECTTPKSREQLKEMAKDFFAEHLGPLERVNLLKDEEETEKNSVHAERVVGDVLAFNISELNL